MGSSTPAMLRRLKLEFVVITMALVGVVLGISFSTNFITMRNTQISQTYASLERVMRDEETSPRWRLDIWRELFPDDQDYENDAEGDLKDTENKDGQNNYSSDAAVMKCFVTQSGTIVDPNEAYEEALVTNDLEYVVQIIMDQEGSQGNFKEAHLAWAKEKYSEHLTVVAFVDTTERDEAIQKQAFNSILIYVASMLAFFAASWWLSSWALRPVADAWDRQRLFIADASHELKTPLTVILANSQILKNDASLSDEAMRWVNSTADEASHMNELVTELLQLARADEATSAGTSSVMAISDIDFSEMIDTATLEFDAVAFERGCLIESEIEPGIHVKGDRSWLMRAVKTLLDNASKYADKGSTVLVTLKREGKRAVYAVNNKGPILTSDELNHIFDRFYRSDKARSRSDTGGFGLGLAIAKSIVDAHGGKISATSTESQGTTFSIIL